MNCKHSPEDYKKMLLHGDSGMTCRYCHKPIRTKNRKKADALRRLLVFIPILLFCIVAGMGTPTTPAAKLAIAGCFVGCLAVSILGWLIVCAYVLEYEELPEESIQKGEGE